MMSKTLKMANLIDIYWECGENMLTPEQMKICEDYISQHIEETPYRFDFVFINKSDLRPRYVNQVGDKIVVHKLHPDGHWYSTKFIDIEEAERLKLGALPANMKYTYPPFPSCGGKNKNGQ